MVRRRLALPSQETLRRYLDFDGDTGVFTWRWRTPDDFGDGRYSKERQAAAWNARFAGKQAFTAPGDGSGPQAPFLGQTYHANRLAWRYLYGDEPDEVEAVNGDMSDLRAANLRATTQSQSQRNFTMQKNNRSGVKGVHWDSDRSLWTANIKIGGRSKYLGRFRSLVAAERARQKAEAMHHYREKVKANPAP